MEKEQTVIVVTPISLIPVRTTGKICHCVRCNEQCWVSDTSIDALKQHSIPIDDVVFICGLCLIPYYKEHGGNEPLKIVPTTQGQIEEIIKALK